MKKSTSDWFVPLAIVLLISAWFAFFVVSGYIAVHFVEKFW